MGKFLLSFGIVENLSISFVDVWNYADIEAHETSEYFAQFNIR